MDGVTIRITGVAKTVAEYFKYRNNIGLDVAWRCCARPGTRRASSDITPGLPTNYLLARRTGSYGG